jgi:hypothetical protein
MHRFFRCPLRRYFLSGPFPSITPHTLIDNQTFQIHDLGPTALSVSSLLTSLLPFHTTSTLQPPRRIRFPFSFPFFLRSVLTGPTYYLPYALCSLIVHVHSSSLASWATRIFYLFPFILLQHDSSFAQFHAKLNPFSPSHHESSGPSFFRIWLRKRCNACVQRGPALIRSFLALAFQRLFDRTPWRYSSIQPQWTSY